MKTEEYKAKYIDKNNYNLPATGEMVIKSVENNQHALFLCPCGCGALLGVKTPGWTLEVDENNKPTINPSVAVLNGCKSHFFVKEGKVIWC